MSKFRHEHMQGCGDPLDRRTMIQSLALAMAGGLLLGGCGKRPGGASALPVLRAAITGKGEGDTRLMLKASAIEPEGFRIDYSVFSSGQLVVEALNGGALDCGNMSEIPPVFAASSPIRSFRQIAVVRADVNNQAVVVPKDSPIQSLADLKGRQVGYVRATTSQYFLIRMLESVGLAWSDIVPIPMGVSDGLAAFSNGKLDAWAIYGYPIQRVMANDGARILKTARGFLSGNYIVLAHVDALADPVRADSIGRYLRMSKRGYSWVASHQNEWAATVAAEIGVPLADVQDEFRRKSINYELRPVTEEAIASQQRVADVFAQQGVIARSVDVRPLWDERFNSVILERA
jgi:sulfonate transport system substrate-binding protein